MRIPESLRIQHHREYALPEGWEEEAYFRLKHELREIEKPASSEYTVRPRREGEIPLFERIINASYENLSVTEEQLWDLTRTPVYERALWLVAEDRDGKAVGCLIGDLDRENREGILEWVQVLPEYRGRGVGKLLVTHALEIMAEKVSFATVSGNCRSQTNPERLYRRCGFTGDDIWHILHKV